MTKDDIRLHTKLIVKRENEFLVGVQIGTRQLRWSTSPYDAWGTRIRLNARMVAEKTNGTIYLFNPIVGQLKLY